jgi:chemotaxis protein CheD
MAAPALQSFFAQRVVIGVGDMSVANNPIITLSTYALGSCVAVVVYDPAVKAGGLLHLMLPESKISAEKAAAQPAMFADTGLPLLFRSLLGLRADRSRLRLFVAGGACIMCANDTFKIGERNTRAVRDHLAANGYPVRQWAVGGTINRTVHLEIGTGNVTLKTPNGTETLSLA